MDLSHAQWRKSSASHPNGDCVEVADMPGDTVAVRDSKNPTPVGPALIFDGGAWDAFLGSVQRGTFDRP